MQLLVSRPTQVPIGSAAALAGSGLIEKLSNRLREAEILSFNEAVGSLHALSVVVTLATSCSFYFVANKTDATECAPFYTKNAKCVLQRTFAFTSRIASENWTLPSLHTMKVLRERHDCQISAPLFPPIATTHYRLGQQQARASMLSSGLSDLSAHTEERRASKSPTARHAYQPSHRISVPSEAQLASLRQDIPHCHVSVLAA